MSLEQERRLEDVKTLIKIWNRFYQILILALRTDQELTPDKEAEFQRIKTVVAEKHDSLMKVIDKDHHIGQNVLLLVKRVISLQEFRRLSVLECNNLMKEWHEANILLYEILGSLEWAVSEAGAQSEKDIRKQVRGSVFDRVKSILISKWARRLYVLVVLTVIVLVCITFWEEISGHAYYKQFILPIVEGVKKGLNLK